MDQLRYLTLPFTDGRYGADTDGRVYGPRGVLKPNRHIRVTIGYEDGQQTLSVARAVYEAFHGSQVEGTVIRHIDGNRENNRLDNLSAVSPEGAGEDRRRHGALPGSPKLNADKVREIRARYAAGGVTQEELARQYGVSGPLINGVISRQRWRHVKP